MTSNNPQTYDLAIIGGGPAGAAAAVYASRKRLKTVFITKDWLSQSSVSEKIENWIGTIAISGADFANSLEKHAKAYGEGIIEFKEGEEVLKLEQGARSKEQGENTKAAATFSITTKKGTYHAKTVLITAGSRRRKLDIPGADKYENKGVTYCATCDGPLYSKQDVIVVGGGNAGFDSAAQLAAYCKSVTLLSRSGFRADPGTIENVLKHPNVKALENIKLKEIKGDNFVTGLVYEDKDGKESELPATGIFAEIGSIPNTTFAKDLIKLDKNNHAIVDPRNQRTSVEGIWAAGDCTDGLFHQNNIAAGDAVKAVEDIYLWLNA
jgi:alkyl hydroperoxide reductase subunit F